MIAAHRNARRLAAMMVLCLPVLTSCMLRTDSPVDVNLQKIEFNMAQLDAAGLRGPADGKVALSYEFCIPHTEACLAEVKSIDPTVQFMAGSPGRIGAGKGQCLCIGSTHQPNYRGVLLKLVNLPYVSRIIECHFE